MFQTYEEKVMKTIERQRSLENSRRESIVEAQRNLGQWEKV